MRDHREVLEKTRAEIGNRCGGLSAQGDCPAPARFEVVTGSLLRRYCGRHVGWGVDRMTISGGSATVTKLPQSQPN